MHQYQRRGTPHTDRLDAYPGEKVRPSYTRPYEPSPSRRPAPARPGPTRAPRGNTRNLREAYDDYEQDYEEAYEAPRTRRPKPKQPAPVPAQLTLYAISMLVMREHRKRGLFGDHVWTVPHHEVHLCSAYNEDAAIMQADEDIYRIFPEEDGFSGHSIDVREVDENFINDLAANRLEIAQALGRYEV